MGQPARALSWSFGPATSRPIRVLLYLATSLVLGAAVYVFGETSLFVMSTVAAPGPVDPGFVGLFVIFFLLTARWVVVLPLFFRDAEEQPSSFLRDEWRATVRWRWVGVGVALVAAVLGAIHYWLWGTDWLLASPNLLAWGALGLGLTVLMVARLLSSTGRVDLQRLALHYNDRRRVDLSSLVGARRVVVGDRTYLWVTFESGVRAWLPRLYLLSTDVADRVWPTLRQQFEATPTEETTVGTTSRESRLATALMFAFAVAVALVVRAAGAPLGLAILVASYFALLAIIALLADAFYT